MSEINAEGSSQATKTQGNPKGAKPQGNPQGDKPGGNPLGTEPVGTLLRKFAIPSIIAMIVIALYNIVDQFFIGHSIGELGNAATNVTFPLATSCVAIALLLGIGGASAFNLTMGRGDREKATYYVGNSAVLLFGLGTLLFIITELFLEPMLRFFGSPDDVFGYACEYVRIIAIGFPFVILANGGAHLVRADGSPKYSMMCNISGAVINTILDPLFIFKLDMGMAGAAWATVIGQVFSGLMVFHYLTRYKTVKLEKKHLRPQWSIVKYMVQLGTSPCINQCAIMIVQIVMNNSLTYYGGISVYGEAVPLACAGIIAKVNHLFFSVCIGIAQGMQPIASFNYGAKQYKRVLRVAKLGITAGLVISCVAFVLFQTIPRTIIGFFGDGSEMYFAFAERYFRIYLFFAFVNNVQPFASTFFTSIGKPGKGAFLALTRQILFLLPLIVILPMIFGIDGIMFAGPIADFIAVTVSVIMLYSEVKVMKKQASCEGLGLDRVC